MKFNGQNLVRAKESCACTGILCMHKTLVHAQERFLCMDENLLHAQDSCAYTRILCMQKVLRQKQYSVFSTQYSAGHPKNRNRDRIRQMDLRLHQV